jgi:SAM-dependent methyltransferase
MHTKPSDIDNMYWDGRHYDLDNKDFVEDIPFYIRQIARHGLPVLELACGTGRITIPLAEKGIDITGLDITEPMLAQARVKAATKQLDITWIKADCRKFTVHRTFKVILFPFNSIGHLHDRESVEQCFARVREHLADDGRFIIDMYNPDLRILTRDPTKYYPLGEYPDPDGHGQIKVFENNTYDGKKQINQITWYYRNGRQENERTVRWGSRIYYPQELDTLLHYNGFTIEEKYGFYDERPFTAMAPKQLIVCRKSPSL